MLRWLAHRWPFARLPRHVAESSRLIVGTTGSGKSEAELHELVRLADEGGPAVVLLDGHGPLAFSTAGHWAARGHEARMVFEPLAETERVLAWSMLRKSCAPGASQRLVEDAETRDEVAQCFLAQRNLATLNDRPWTKEWLEAAIDLCLAQPELQPLPTLLDAFRVGSPGYERLLHNCTRIEVAEKLRSAERLRRRNEVQYEIQTGASRRLLEPVCTSEVVRLRSRGGPFDWPAALREKRLIAFDGGALRSREVKRTLFLLVSMEVIHAVRRHFALTQRPLPVVLVLEEAGALGLLTPFVLGALQELRKAGLSIHLITQSSLDFGDRDLFEALLANVPHQAWHQCLSPADQELGARALANATFDPLAVHYRRTRAVSDGVRPVTTESRAETTDPGAGTLRHERRTTTAFLSRQRLVSEAVYKSPGLQEQEFRTRLATLGVGERLIRDRRGVWYERVTPLRPPRRLRGAFDAFTRQAIARIRQQDCYSPCTPEESPLPAPEFPDAAVRLRQRADAGGAAAPAPAAVMASHAATGE